MSLFGWLTGTDKYGAAQSALIAKYTFSQLTEHDKDHVRVAACGVLEAGGYPPDMIDAKIDKMGVNERYCLYAMAMAMVGIKPALKGVLYNDEWYHITNPFVALINAEKQIKIAQYEIKNKHNVHIDLAYNNKEAAFDNLGQKQRAIDDYNEAISLKPNDAVSYYNRGLAYGSLGQYQRAIEDYNEFIRLKPNDAVSYYNRGTTYANLGQQQRAIDDYNEAIRLEPDFADAYNKRGNIYSIQGNNELFCRDAQKACALGDCKALELAKSKGLCH